VDFGAQLGDSAVGEAPQIFDHRPDPGFDPVLYLILDALGLLVRRARHDVAPFAVSVPPSHTMRVKDG
jgi:hypothetical protein